MNKKGTIPMAVPNIGGAQKPQFNPADATQENCQCCGAEHYVKLNKLGKVSKLAPSNATNQDILLEIPCYVCNSCGWEYGKELKPA